MRQSAAPAARNSDHGGTESTEEVADDTKIAVFLLHGCGLGRVLGRVGGATFEGGLAADLLQVQRGEISDSIFGCDGSEPAAQGRGERVEFTFYLFRLLTFLRHIGGPAFFSGT